MKLFAACALLMLVNLPSAFAISQDDQAARDAALQWLALLDNGHYPQACHAMPQRVRAGKSEENFLSWLQARRAPLGHALSRKYMKAVHKRTLTGLPDGNYYEIGFKTSWDRKKNGAELVVLTSETGHWQVSGYKIY